MSISWKTTYILFLSLFLLTGLGSCISERQLAYCFSTKQQDPNILGSIQLIPKQKKQTISFTATLYSASMIAIELHGLEGSNPRESGYYAALWQGTQIEDLHRKKAIQSIDLDSKEGSFVFELDQGINNIDYIIGLGINRKDSTSFCSTLIIPKNQARYIPISTDNAFSSSVEVVQLGTDSLIIAYETPAFNLPRDNNNWIAIFSGRFTAHTFKGVNLLKKQRINSNLNQGMLAINHIEGGLVPNQMYTVVYGMGGESSEATEWIIAATEFRIPNPD
ncbi:hypothetical protein [Flavobacterium sp. NKUCC04_CG]|uniref:hypothetical protein n=1 Tax=Flavobacterium sp. NKUCC04_CG TaxID=2842121 RepID=UPI001C5A7AD9|nr:hypothetical protein [Flavobacterium sp. NKUCC04_CG]MBW3519856.1 hypothetical protein [Flavobacterium sp. NKUCC04_CG]